MEVLLSDRERVALWSVMNTADVKGHAEARRFNRTWDALVLDVFDPQERREGPVDATEEPFELTPEAVDYLYGILQKCQFKGAGARLLGPVMDRLEDAKSEATKKPQLQEAGQA